MNTINEIFGEIISVYTRAQAIEDGVLIDVSEMAREAGFNCPVAITATLFAECIEVTKKNRRSGDTNGRLWDTLWMTMWTIKRSAGGQMLFPKVIYGNRTRTLKAVAGPGDNMELTITIMLPEED